MFTIKQKTNEKNATNNWIFLIYGIFKNAKPQIGKNPRFQKNKKYDY